MCALATASGDMPPLAELLSLVPKHLACMFGGNALCLQGRMLVYELEGVSAILKREDFEHTSSHYYDAKG